MARTDILKCEICGNIVEVLYDGGGKIFCCGAEMGTQAPNTVDAAREKHVPVIERTAGGVKVTVGSVPHPMEDKHYIQWIELIAGGTASRVFLGPGGAPEAYFPGPADGALEARAYCNIHGLWSATA